MTRKCTLPIRYTLRRTTASIMKDLVWFRLTYLQNENRTIKVKLGRGMSAKTAANEFLTYARTNQRRTLDRGRGNL